MMGFDEGLGDRNRLRAQAEQNRWGRYAQTGNIRDLDGGFMDPGFDALFQSMSNQGVDAVGDHSMGVRKGMFAPQAIASVQQPGMESTQLGRAGIDGARARMSPSLAGIDAAMKKGGRNGGR